MDNQTILALAANPSDTARLRLDQEIRDIKAGLERSRHRHHIRFETVMAPRIEDIRRAMLHYRPFMVHFGGHGYEGNGLAIEDENGGALYLGDDHLSEFFQLFADSVRCVFLNACYSETPANAIARHIEHVVGMKIGVKDKLAIKFAVAFYDAIFDGNACDFAFRLARNNVAMEFPDEKFLPVFLCRTQAHTSPEIRRDQSYSFRLGYRVGGLEATQKAFDLLPAGQDKDGARNLLQNDLEMIRELAHLLSLDLAEGPLAAQQISRQASKQDPLVAAAFNIGKILGLAYHKCFNLIASGQLRPDFSYARILDKAEKMLSQGELGPAFLNPVKEHFFEINHTARNGQFRAAEFGRQMDRIIIDLANQIRQPIH